MTLIQEAASIMEKMPKKNQQLVVDLLRVLSQNAEPHHAKQTLSVPFKRTGKGHFNLPKDFDEHFDDMNDEIASMFYGEDA